MTSVSPVVIDEGTFKYILIKLTPPSGESRYIVRGDSSCEYHADILDTVENSLSKCGYEVDCVGGGRICHQSKQKTINVYGYSVGFGRADHQITVNVLAQHYSDYKITWSNEGY